MTAIDVADPVAVGFKGTVRSLRSAGLLGDERPKYSTSNVDAAELAFQRWYRFKEAFTPTFVAEVMTRLPRMPRNCLDPFGGSGTTALTAQALGVRPTTIEVNPFLADLIEAKLRTHDLGQVGTEWLRILEEVARNPVAPWPVVPPPSFVEPGVGGRWIFNRDIAGRIGAYVAGIEKVEEPGLRSLFRVLLGSALIQVSNVVISGKGRRYRGGRTLVRPSVEQLDLLLDSGFRRMYQDIARHGARPEPGYRLLRGDSRELIGECEPVDLVLFSPPYPNSFDYTDIYNVELWALGYLGSAADNRTLREATLRSHVQIVRSFEAILPESSTLQKVSLQLRALGPSLWSPHLPAMVEAYFADMCTVLSKSRNRLVEDGRIVAVVGDSRYAGMTVNVAGILSELAEPLGLRVVRAERVRSMRSSAQQGGELELLESLIEFASL